MRLDRPLLQKYLPALVAALFAVPVLVDLATARSGRSFSYMASDAYYYLNVARHAAHEHRFAFDGERATSGFHPLWQIVLVPITWMVEILRGQPHHLLGVVILLNTLAIAIALALLVRAVLRESSLASMLLGLPVGAYALTLLWSWRRTSAEILYGTPWSYINGMESSLVLLSFSVIVFLFVTRDVWRARMRIWFGLVLALFVLARLDHIFFVAAILAASCLTALIRRDREQLRGWITIGLIFSAPIAVYIAINWIFFDSPFPVSGSLKSSFPHISAVNYGRLSACLTAPTKQAYFRVIRVAQAVIPAGVALLYLLLSIFWRPRTRLGKLLIPVGIGTILLGLYDYSYVDLTLHGHWYFPVSTVFASLVALELLGRTRLDRLPIRVEVAIMVVITAVLSWAFFKIQPNTTAGMASATFYLDEVPKIHQHYGSEIPKLLENDDGIVSFATGYPAMSGMGLALDPEAARAWMTLQIIPLSVSRGYNRVTSLLYWKEPWLGPHSSSEHLSGHFKTGQLWTGQNRPVEPTRICCSRYHESRGAASGPPPQLPSSQRVGRGSRVAQRRPKAACP